MTSDPVRRKIDPAAVSAQLNCLLHHLFAVDLELDLTAVSFIVHIWDIFYFFSVVHFDRSLGYHLKKPVKALAT